MDFYQIKERIGRNGVIEVYPDFKVCRSKDFMIRGKYFYAIWDEDKNMWSTDEYDVQRLVDTELLEYKQKTMSRGNGNVQVKLMADFSSKSWAEFRSYMNHVSDNSHQLDEKLTFSNTEVKKKDHVSKRLPYALEEGKCDAYEEIMGTLYGPEERAKLEWAIGAIVSGDARDIQKFIVLYGEAGTGKSTILNIIQRLFDGYYTAFEAKALTSANNSFSTEVFRSNPLVAIQHDGDLSKIEDNTKLNSIISHEEMTMNEKYKPSYMAKVNCFLFMATNKPVKITDGKSGIIRRLIDVRPSGHKIPTKRYQTLITQIDSELGAIANHCLDVYREMGKNYYSSYRPIEMMFQTDVFFNFVEANFYIFKEEEGISLAQAYEIYKTYCDEALVDFKLPRHKFREELKNYFEDFSEVTRINGKQVRSYYSKFIVEKFKNNPVTKEELPDALSFDSTLSLFDEICADCSAQYASDNETPILKWNEVTTTLSNLNTSELHYVRVPINHIVIDFDLKDKTGNKSLESNIREASKWTPTYAELSKSGKGIHLHYIYDGEATALQRIFAENIEVKVAYGNSSLRRKLTKCNTIPITTINSGLPLKGEKVINFDAVRSEKGLRELIKKNLNKEIHPGTKPSMDFIFKILDDAHKSGLSYDITDMRPRLLAFANNSSHQADYCLDLLMKMKFKSEEISMASEEYREKEFVFFDVEVFKNLFVVCWKVEGKPCVKMINPKASEMESLIKRMLIGFNCRRYDNHILYARYIGYEVIQLYDLSQRIIKESRNCMFGEAYNISYVDVYEFSSKKQSLKKFEIELGIHHQELGLAWNEEVPEELWEKVADYCCNDVIATEAVFNDRREDFVARQILAKLSGLAINDTTQMHTARILFGDDKRPQDKFIYTDLSQMFPGYVYDHGKSTYRDQPVNEGGYIHAEPGMYGDVPVLDIESMHPRSAILLKVFGPYTDRFEELVEGRLAVKHGNKEVYSKVLNGVLTQLLNDNPDISEKALSYALKIAINIVYGMTSAKFDNKFKDPRNIDNIVAKRGSLFMVDLQLAVQKKGFVVAHIKTDSIKIPNATPEIIQFVMDFGKKYGYSFEHESTYEKFCLVNDSVYIAKIGWTPSGKHVGEWDATGAQFAQPYVFKSLFTKEPIVFEDMCEVKTVNTALYLDMNESLPDVSKAEKALELWDKKWPCTVDFERSGLNEREGLKADISKGHDYRFVGKAGSFCPIKSGHGGGVLLRIKDNKYYAAAASKGYRWLEAELVCELHKEESIDEEYYKSLVDEAIVDISQFGDFEYFIADKTGLSPDFVPPWLLPCGTDKYKSCYECENCTDFFPEDGKCKLNYDISKIKR